MHSLECGQGKSEQTHPVNQKQNIQTRADHLSSRAQVSLTLVSQYTNDYSFMRLELQSPDENFLL